MRQFMVITSNLQTFEGIVLKKANGDFEYLNGLITYSDGRIERVAWVLLWIYYDVENFIKLETEMDKE